MPEAYETPGVIMAQVSGTDPTPEIGKREGFVDGKRQSIPSVISRRWITRDGNDVIVPVHTSRECKKQNPYTPYGQYPQFIGRQKMRSGWVDYKTGECRPDRLRVYDILRKTGLDLSANEEQKKLAEHWPGDEKRLHVDERELVKNWPAHRDELMALRKLKHQIDDAHFVDQANSMLERELKGMREGVRKGIAEGFQELAENLAKQAATNVAQQQQAQAEPARRPGRPRTEE